MTGMDERLLWAIASMGKASPRRFDEMRNNFAELDIGALDLNGEDASRIAADFEMADKTGIEIVTYLDDDYPDALRSIALPPPYFYLRGSRAALSREVDATIVGTRYFTNYGISVAMEFSQTLASYGVGIISGGASGIDAAAHRGALNANGVTIAVFGCGIDIAYPKENERLFDEIAHSGGALISEFPFGSPPEKRHFPYRNRLMTALGNITVVVEAGKNSGALSSAQHAADQGKTVFVVPGNITSSASVGANELLRRGAQFALSSQDLLEELLEKNPDFFGARRQTELSKESKPKKQIKKAAEKAVDIRGLSPQENAVINALRSGDMTVDEIENYCQSAANLLGVLGILEMKGIIKLAQGKKYTLIGE